MSEQVTTIDVERSVTKGKKCYRCEKPLNLARGFATFPGWGEGKVYLCDVCYEQDPEVGRKTEVYSRVVGYLRPTEQWNDAKQHEFKDRVVFEGWD